MNQNKHNTASNKETVEPTAEHVQFSDGRMAIGFRTAGDRVPLDLSYTKHLQNRGGPNAAIVATASGRRFAVGKSVAVMLPPLSRETGRYQYGAGTPVAAISVRRNLPDITIGEAWPLVGQEDKVTDVLFDYSTTTPGIGPGEQIGFPNPFDHAREILETSADKLEARRQ